jgi:putative PIN family toxin of toxin-antitoxin system
VLAYSRIRERLHLEDDELEAILIALLAQAEVVPGHLELPGVTRDPKDDAVVACAVEGQAEYISILPLPGFVPGRGAYGFDTPWVVS